MRRWRRESALVVATLAALAGAVAGGEAAAQDASATDLQAFVGRWSGENISDEQGVTRWTVERSADGRYSASRTAITRAGAVELTEQGTWSVRDGVLAHEPASGSDAKRQAWRTTALADGCLQLRAVDPAGGRPSSPAWRAGECRLPAVRPVPERIQHRCLMQRPAMSGGTVDLQIAREADGRHYAVVGGEREPRAVDVRDYPVLVDFKPRQEETMTNAGEGLLVLVQINLDRDEGLRRSLGFDPAQARSVRAWVIRPPRPERPMEYLSAGRFVLMQAFDAQGRMLGGAAYMPFIVACPTSP